MLRQGIKVFIGRRIYFLAYYFHWSYREIISLSYKERIYYCDETSNINKKSNGSKPLNKNIFDVDGAVRFLSVFHSGRLPFQVDVTCNHGTVDDFIPSFNFVVILNQYVFGFSEVSGLDKELYCENIEEGGNPGYVFTRKYSTNVDTITLRRGMLIRGSRLASNAIRTAFSQATMIGNNVARKAALVVAAALDPVATLEDGPAYGFIQLFDRSYKKAKATFSFFSHGASNWNLSSLSATSGEFMYEEIRLCCSDLRRMSDKIVSPEFWNASGKDDHTFYDLNKFEGLNNEKIEKIEKIEKQKEKNREEFFVEPEKEDDERTPEDLAREAMKERKKRIAKFEKQKEKMKEVREEQNKIAEEAKKIIEERINKSKEVDEEIKKRKELDDKTREENLKKFNEELEKKKNEREEYEKQLNEIEEQKKQNREKFEQNRDEK